MARKYSYVIESLLRNGRQRRENQLRRGPLSRAMSAECYEFGRFNDKGEFESLLTLSRWDIDLSLSEVLYFKSVGDDDVVVMRSMGNDRQVRISRRALDGIDEIAKHTSWSYERRSDSSRG